ncbi:MAG: CAP domain-containing protein [Myxococcales bacterium]|nr:CAP domain-containing protein [Myxococcales bacterium]
MRLGPCVTLWRAVEVPLRTQRVLSALLSLPVLLVMVHCATGPASPSRLTLKPPQVGAPSYEVASKPGAVRAQGTRASVFERAIADGARVAESTLVGDGRLATLAAWLGAHMRHDGDLPAVEISEFYARHLGLVDVMPRAVVLPDASDARLAQQLSQAVALRLGERDYTHYGLAPVVVAGQRRWLLILSYRPLSLGRVPRALPTGSAIHMLGRVPGGFGNPRVEVFGPGGAREVVPVGVGPEFDVRVPTSVKGTYRVEVLAEGKRGLRSLARLPVYVGVMAPRQEYFLPRDDLERARAAQARLVADLQAERRRAQLPALTLDPLLSIVAAQHCTDMRDGAFFGHRSPRTGRPSDRVERAGFGRAVVRENIARAGLPDGLFKSLIARPGQRRNVLSSEPTHMGVAVVPERWAGGVRFIATQLLVPVLPDIDVEAAPAELLALLNAARKERGVAPVRVDSDLEFAARQTVGTFFEPPLEDEQATVEQTNRMLGELRLHFRRTGAVVAVVNDLSRVTTLAAVLDPSVTHVGFGVSQGDRHDRTPNAIAVTITLGWQR